MSNFAFLHAEWPEVHEAATKAESLVHSDARASCFYSRRALERLVAWLYLHDRALRLPYQDHLSALLHEPTFRTALGPAVWNKTRIIKELGNQAVHSPKPMRALDAQQAVCELFHIGFWLARTYGRKSKPADTLKFDNGLLPKTSPIPPQTLAQLQALAEQLAERDARLSALLADHDALDSELKRLREELAQVKADSEGRPDQHDYSEAETRDYFIDLLLKEAGWPLDRKEDREYEVSGMPNTKGKGYVDYVLWGDDGKPLAVVEAKRTRRDPRVGQRQAKLYADCLEAQFQQRPIIFYTNGYQHWIWDDASYPPRQVQGFYKKDELELLIQRRRSRQPLAAAPINEQIVERYYQTRAIRRIGESFDKDLQRKALIVMATGAGKTRTVIALCDLLMRCNWVKRVLFLADRVPLVKQAVGAFKRHLPSSSPVNLVTEKESEGRVYVSTYQTMMRQIDSVSEERAGRGIAGLRKFGVGHFDLIIVDEAHRSVYQKYRAIFDYFDSLLVGLTATPRTEIDRNTYSLFELETGIPTDSYELDTAVKDGFLVPPKSVSVPLKFQREGIRYDELSEEEQEQWDSVEWSEDGDVPGQVEPEAVNKWLFNKDTVDKVLQHLMTHGLKVAGDERIGKTIIFAKNRAHAYFIAERFDKNYPQYKGHFAQVIEHDQSYAQDLIDSFEKTSQPPQIAISVDMLDTGIDIPDVVNLVFFKLVRSKTKFWQMLGRGTRLRPDLFGPGKDKRHFFVFDYCQNLEFFSQDPEVTDGSLSESLGKKLFTSRVELITELDRKQLQSSADSFAESRPTYGEAKTDQAVRMATAELLQQQVAAMNLNNFIVRPRRRAVEKFAQPQAWRTLSEDAAFELVREVAGLPSELPEEDEEAKRFDLLMLRVQLAALRCDPGFPKLSEQVRTIAGLLEEQASIPMIKAQLALILEVQSDEFWQDVTMPILEQTRKRLRSLIKLIEKRKRQPVYTDFEDEIGAGLGMVVDLPGLGSSTDFECFRSKAQAFLRAHQDHLAIHKLRTGTPLTASDLAELERILIESGVGGPEEIRRASTESEGLGLFVRSLIGLDREAAKRALAGFLSGKTHNASQIEFINKIVDHLTEHGVMSPERLYESPFTDVSPKGPEGLFSSSQVDELIALLTNIRKSETSAA